MENTWKTKAALYLISQGITLLGSSIVQIAIIWYVAIATSSGIWVTILTLCAFIPQMLISPLAGVLADRYNRKYMIILFDSIIAITTLVLYLFIELATVEYHLIAIIITSAIRSLGSGMQTPAVNALLPQLVPESLLLKCNGINSSIQSAIQFLSPMISGVILFYGTLNEILLIDIFTAIVGVSLLSIIKVSRITLPSSIEKSSVLEEMKIGFTYIRKNKTLLKLFQNYGMYIFLSVPSGFLITLFVERTFNNSYLALSIVEIVGFAGMFLGGLLFTISKKERNITTLFLQGIIGYGLLSIFLGFSKEFWYFGILMFLVSFCIPIIQSALITFLQENVDPEVQGRIFSVLQAIFSGLMPLGMLVFGPLSDYVSLDILFIVAGISMTIIGIISILSLKKWEV